MDRTTTQPAARGLGALLLATYGVAFAWSALWFALGPEERTNLFFREGGPIDLGSSVWLLGASTLFGLAGVRGRGSKLRPFWFVASLGFLFLGIDERFQGHELLSHEVDAPVPLGLRNWSDAAVLAYAAIAAGLVLWRLPQLWRARQLRWLGITASALAAISTGIDSIFPASASKDIWEETFKVLSAAGFFLVAFEAFTLEARGLQGDGPAPTRMSVGLAVATLAAVLTLGFAVLGDDLIGDRLGMEAGAWDSRVRQNWGSPHSWLVCVLLWISSALLALASRGGPGRATRRGPLVLGAFLAILGVGEALRATRFRTLDRLVEDQFPATVAQEVTFMHEPLELPGVLFLVSAVACVLMLLRSLSRTRADATSSGPPAVPGTTSFLWTSAAGVALLAVALPVNEFGGSVANWLYAPALRIAAGALLLVAASQHLLLVGSSETPRGSASPPPSGPPSGPPSRPGEQPSGRVEV